MARVTKAINAWVADVRFNFNLSTELVTESVKTDRYLIRIPNVSGRLLLLSDQCDGPPGGHGDVGALVFATYPSHQNFRVCRLLLWRSRHPHGVVNSDGYGLQISGAWLGISDSLKGFWSGASGVIEGPITAFK